MKVSDVMTRDVVFATPTTYIEDVLELMLARKVSCLPVVDEHRSLVGIVSVTDLLRPAGAAGTNPLVSIAFAAGVLAREDGRGSGIEASQVMRWPVFGARPDESVEEASERMARMGLRRLPVIEDGKLVGVVSRRDLLRAYEAEGADDELIVQRIERMLERFWFFPADHQVHVQAHKGEVTLTGVVPYERDARVIEALTAATSGVLDVENKLEFRSRGYPESHVAHSTGDRGYVA